MGTVANVAKRGGSIVSVNTVGQVGYRAPARTIGNRAIFIGTSITFRGFNAAGPQVDGWWVPMNIALKWPFTTLINASSPGRTTQGMIDTWPVEVAAKYNDFDVAFIEVGPNGSSVAHVELMAGWLLDNGKSVIIMTPTPATTFSTAALESISLQCAGINDFAKNSGSSNVFVVDAGRLVAHPSTGTFDLVMGGDGIHPNAVGAGVIGVAAAKVVTMTRPLSRASRSRRETKEFINNPFFVGSYASGVRGFQAGTGVTGSGPEATAVAIVTGTFTSVVVSQGPQINQNTNSLVVTAIGASADWANIRISAGSVFAGLGLAAKGGRDALWTPNTTYTVGDYAVHPGYTPSVFSCIGVVSGNSGVSGATVPNVVNAGDVVTDGGVIWSWQLLPAGGDVITAESEFEITNLTGGVLYQFHARIRGAADQQFIDGYCPFAGGFNSGVVPKTWPLSGRVAVSELPLAYPGVAASHVIADWDFYFSAGGGGIITIPYVSLRKP